MTAASGALDADPLARSRALTEHGRDLGTGDAAAWLDGRKRAHPFTVRHVPLTDLEEWSFHGETGDLVHRTGGFFSVTGVRVRGTELSPGDSHRPILLQPEVGVLGILAREFDGVTHFLMQAKMEPGNPGLLQISPTVQATHSNYSRLHRGSQVRHIGRFLGPDRLPAAVDTVQTEHGGSFYRKANRNMVATAASDIEEMEDFRWFTLGQLGALLRRDDTVNMCARSILSHLPPTGEDGRDPDVSALVSWLATERVRHRIHAELLPLGRIRGWEVGRGALATPDDRGFRITGVSVRADSREIGGWDQPLLEPADPGANAFLVRRIGGRVRLLVAARPEVGSLHGVEAGPTVQSGFDGPTYADHPALVDAVLEAREPSVVYTATHSEEGGRFLNARNRYMFVETDAATAPEVPPAGLAWVTVGELAALNARGLLNVQARTLLGLLTTGAADLQGIG